MHLTSNSFYLNHLHLKKFKIKNIRFLTLRTLGDFRGIVQTPLFWFYFGPFLYNGVYFVCFSFNCILDQYQWRTVILREVLKRQENFLSLIQDQHCFVLIYLDRYLSNLNYQSIKVVVEHEKNLRLRPGILNSKHTRELNCYCLVRIRVVGMQSKYKHILLLPVVFWKSVFVF